MNMIMINRVPTFILALLLLFSCRKEELIVPPEEKPVAPGGEGNEITGFYLLNEGNMGSNKATMITSITNRAFIPKTFSQREIPV